MIIKPLIKIHVDPSTREERLKALLDGSALSSQNTAGSATGRMRAQDDGFFFEGLSVGGARYDLLFQKDWLGSGSATQEDHWNYAKAQKDIVVPSGLVIYAMDHLAYTLRNDPSAKSVVQKYRAFRAPDWASPYLHTGTRFDYQQGKQDATMRHMSLDGTIASLPVKIPAFNKLNDDWSFLQLADKQPEAKLGTVCSPVPAARPFLEGLLGPDYDDAGAVYQYLSSRHSDGDLRETRAWTPTLANRKISRALVLGVYDDDRFSINANNDIYSIRPARGVAVRKKFPHEITV